MIFGKQNVVTALSYISYFYNKIILVDTMTDTYLPIKIDDDEWKNVPDKTCFSNWVKRFAESDLFVGDPESLIRLLDLNKLKAMKKPDQISYWRKIGREEHWITLELIPIGEGQFYIFLKDMSKMMSTYTAI